MKDNYLHGGSQTPQYYCSKCNKAHTIHSEIGKEHKRYMENGYKCNRNKL